MENGQKSSDSIPGLIHDEYLKTLSKLKKDVKKMEDVFMSKSGATVVPERIAREKDPSGILKQ